MWISSYLPRSCGIAYYSADYIEALKSYAKKKKEKIEIKVIAHTDASLADYPIIDIKDREWPNRVFKVVKKERPDVVHIQHEYGLYETYGDRNKRVIDLIKMIKGIGIPVVMTYHSVYKKLEMDFREFMSSSLKDVDVGIVHCDYQRKALKDNIGWEPNNIYVLPHGSREDIRLDREDCRKGFAYTSDQLIVGSAGLASERKGFRTLIKMWPKVVKKFPNSLLALHLKPEESEESKIYIHKIFERIVKSPVIKNIEIVVKDYSITDFYRKLKSFDVLVLPYKSESQSGVLAHGFSVGLPVIATDIEGLGAEIRNSEAGIAVKHKEDFVKYIIKMLSSKKLRDRCSRNALRYVENVSGWSIIARKTINIYKKLW